MAEERICICKLEGNATESVCGGSISRQKAIEKIAKALIRADYPQAQESIWDMRWDNPTSKDYYLIMANSALNALLPEDK